MATAPYGVRLLVGVATVAAEETMKLPQTILMYPMTLASQAAQFVMRWQQGLAELAVKGDSTLEMIFPPKDDQPEWATFDEDLDEDADRILEDLDRSLNVDAAAESGPESAGDGHDAAGNGSMDGQRAEGRFALYSEPGRETTAPRDAAALAADAPEIAVELDYDELTLAQLRARLRSLSVEDLNALLAYEEAGRQRAPFQTLLANRITRTTSK